MADIAGELVQRLLRSADAISQQQAARLVDEVRQQAESEVRQLLLSACKASLLRQVVHQLEQSQPTTAVADDAASRRRASRSSASRAVAPADAFTAKDQPALPPDDEAVGLYAYAIVSSDYPCLAGDMPAVAAEFPLRLLRVGELQVIFSHVSLREFSPGGWAERSEDQDWMEATVRAHDQALRRAMERGPLIPLRFGTIFYCEADLTHLLTANRARLLDALDRLAGKEEWGVKIMCGVRAAFDPPGSVEAFFDSSSSDNSSGRAYLLEKQRQRRARSDTKQDISSVAYQCHQALSAAACEVVELPIRRRGVEEGELELLHNGSYLLDRSRVKAFHSMVDALAERHQASGLVFEMSGPWPPYDFVNLELSLESANEPLRAR